jgi:hypothetical protein
MDPYIMYGFGTKIEVNFGTDFSFLFAIFGSYGTIRIADCGHKKLGRKRWTTVRFWHEKRGIFLWDSFCAVRYFPWLEM